MEIVEPYLIWKKLFDIVDTSFPLTSPPSAGSVVGYSHKEGLSLIEYTLKSFKLTDEDIKHMHLPLVLAALTQKLKVTEKKKKRERYSNVFFFFFRIQ